MEGVNSSHHDYGEAPDTCPPSPCLSLLLGTSTFLKAPVLRVCFCACLSMRVPCLCLCGCLQVHGRGDLGLLDALLHPEFNQGKRYIYLHVRTC
jgi:hypothetical protein